VGSREGVPVCFDPLSLVIERQTPHEKRQKNSIRASALQITLSVALISISAILLASTFKAAPAASGPNPPIAPAAQDAPGTQTPEVVQLVGPVHLNQDLRTLPYIPNEGGRGAQPRTRYPRGTGAPPPLPETSPWLKSVINGIFRPVPNMPPPLLTFDGMTVVETGCSCAPPDTIGDVGPNHYVEALNVAFRVYDKSGNPLTPPTTFNSLFAPLVGTPCANQNRGDPFVFYDHLADRWVLSDFASVSYTHLTLPTKA
jgi:hypothetical protein